MKGSHGSQEKEAGDITNISQSFLSNWSAHGFSHLVKSDRFRKAWLLVVLASIAGIIYFIVSIITKAVHPPVATKLTSKLERAIPLPAITFCNFNVYNKTAAFENDSLVGEWLVWSIVHALEGRRSEIEIYLKAMDQDISNWEARLPSLTGADGRNVTDEFRKVAHTKEKSILAADNPAKYQSVMENITVINTDMGFCFTYQTQDHVIRRSGSTEGLVLYLDIRTEEYTINERGTQEEGFKVFIHDKSETPSLKNHGVIVSDSQSYFIGIKKHERLNYNIDGGCIDTENAENPLAYYSDYTRVNCFSECERNHTVGICGCKLIHQRGGEEVCNTIIKLMNCTDERDMFRSNVEAQEKCSSFCKPACEAVEYEAMTTSGKYPTSIVDKIARLRYGDENASEWAGLLKVHIYFASIEVTTVEYITTYGFKELWGDLGGCLGLCLGASIISILELIEYVIKTAILKTRPREITEFQVSPV